MLQGKLQGSRDHWHTSMSSILPQPFPPPQKALSCTQLRSFWEYWELHGTPSATGLPPHQHCSAGTWLLCSLHSQRPRKEPHTALDVTVNIRLFFFFKPGFPLPQLPSCAFGSCQLFRFFPQSGSEGPSSKTSNYIHVRTGL